MTVSEDEFLGRNLDPDLEKILMKFSSELSQLVSFGVNILKWDLNSETKGEYSIPAALLLRNYIELIDAISILLKTSSIDPCKPLLRVCLETLFYIEYLVNDDQVRRGLSFTVWKTHQNLKNYQKYDGESTAFKDTAAKYKKDRFMKNSEALIYDQSRKAILNAKSLLELPQYKEINDEYLKQNSARRNPAWYSLFGGPKDVEQLAAHSQLHAMYEGFYRSWSNTSHGTDILQGKLSGDLDGRAEIVQIRYAKDAQEVTTIAFTLSITLFRTYIEKRIPEKKGLLDEWYLSVKDFFMSLQSHKYFQMG